MCGANRAHGQRGYCGATDELIVARAALHHWEEPPISGNRGSGTVFFSHCPLRCVYCQNAEIAAGQAGETISPQRLAAIFNELQALGAHNINLVTPTHYASQILWAVDVAREAGLNIPVVYNTSGYERAEAIRSLRGRVDVYLTDFKYYSASPAGAYSNAPDYCEYAMRALSEMVEQTGAPCYTEGEDGISLLRRGVVVRHMLLPGMLEDSKAIARYVVERYGSDVKLSLMNQYTPLRRFPEHPELNERVCNDDYEELLDYVDSLGDVDYFWQEGEASLESFIPAFDGTGVREE